MPDSRSIRAAHAPQVYSCVIDNFRRAYAEKHNGTAEELSDHDILLAWEYGWSAADCAEEDSMTLEFMRDLLLDRV